MAMSEQVSKKREGVLKVHRANLGDDQYLLHAGFSEVRSRNSARGPFIVMPVNTEHCPANTAATAG